MTHKTGTKKAPALIGAAAAPIAVGLPVYNGEPYLSTALESLLAQQEVDFELWIGDNCSTDGTEEICRQVAARDKRVRYQRRSKNVGPTRNHNLLAQECSSRYFTWAAADDAYEPYRLSRMLEALRDMSNAVLAFTWARQINAQGDTIGRWRNPCKTDHSDPIVRLRDLIGLEHENYHCYGLYDRRVLLRTALLPPIKNNDRVLIAELALHGRFAEVKEELLIHRLHDQRLTQSVSSREWYRTQRTDRKTIVMPNVEEAGWYIKAIMRAPIRADQRIPALLALKPWLRANTIPMARNVIRAIVDSAQSIGQGKPR